MKPTSLLLVLLTAAPAWAVAPVDLTHRNPAAVPGRANAAPLPMKFTKVPLGNVVRVLSAKFSVQVSIVANARAPITGDFSGMELRPALAEAARQAGLVVTALGADPSAGFSLAPPAAKMAGPAERGGAEGDAATTDAARAELEAASRHRAELLRQRANLLEKSPSPGSQG